MMARDKRIRERMIFVIIHMSVEYVFILFFKRYRRVPPAKWQNRKP
jgi:hypothetical protein